MSDILKEGKFVWNEKYNIVKEIDDQHKQLFAIINKLIDEINSTPKQESVNKIITEILDYKNNHFATEEKYFHQFNYAGTEEHEAAHRYFSEQIIKINDKYLGDSVSLAFELIDFLENWLIMHLMTIDQKYKQCFLDHGLR